MTISIELIPRSTVKLTAELSSIKHQFRAVDAINIPDLTRMDMRSWEGCGIAQRYFSTTIPHLRACDVNPEQPLPMVDYLCEHDISEVLVVTGDWDADGEPKTTSVQLIKRLRQELPHLTIYAALDPYRGSLQSEQAYCEEKVEAGADGFFTQPFFDLRLLEVYSDMMRGAKVFWGVSPVVTGKSADYWRKRNKVIFPAGFEPTLEWNRAFACNALTHIRAQNDSAYFMPIRVDLRAYLGGIL